MSDYISKADAASKLGCSIRTLERYIKAGVYAVHKQSFEGRHRVFLSARDFLTHAEKARQAALDAAEEKQFMREVYAHANWRGNFMEIRGIRRGPGGRFIRDKRRVDDDEE